MKTINLFFDFEFTSLSPDAQIISIGIVSDCSKSFYAEFSDFEINRCDDWVKENVISKLIGICEPDKVNKYCSTNFDIKGKYILYQREKIESDGNYVHYDESPYVHGNFEGIKYALKNWLPQFSDYQIQFVCDCGTFDWFWMLQLLAEWENKEIETEDPNVIFHWLNPIGFSVGGFEETIGFFKNRQGLPKLPENISPVPEDLNDLIAYKKEISVREAFDLDREEMAFGIHSNSAFKKMLDEEQFSPYKEKINKHNSLWDAKIIKRIYNKLK